MKGSVAARARSGLHDEDALGKAYDARLMRRLWRYLRPHRGLVRASILLLPPVTFLHLAQPYILKEAIDRHVLPAGGSFEGLLTWGLLFAGALALEYVLRYQQLFAMQILGQRAMHTLRVETFSHLQGLATSFFHRTPSGRLLTRLTTDVDALNEMFASGVVSIGGDLITLFVIVIILFALSTRLALTTLLVAPLVVLLAWGFRAIAREAFRNIRVKIARINATLAESLYGIREIQMCVREGRNIADFDRINAEHHAANLRSIFADAVLFALVELLSVIATAAVLWQGGVGIGEDVVTFGTLVAFLDYIAKFFIPIRDLSAKFTVMQSGMAAAERIFGLLDEKEALPAPVSPRAPDPSLAVELAEVSFAYRQDDLVLRQVSFRVAPGESVAIVGATGAGKSTIVNLLLRLYDVQGGAVRVGGVDVREQDVRALRREIAVVHQDVFLFSGDVLSNITLADERVSEADARAAAEAVGLGPLIARLPEGYASPVRERGANFSTGEKQLLAFARALARNPRILVLDEATSSVDPESEARIQRATRLVMQGRTSIVIAHRLTTIQDVDRILVLHHGRIVEQGTHAELLAQGGAYARLHALQFSGG